MNVGPELFIVVGTLVLLVVLFANRRPAADRSQSPSGTNLSHLPEQFVIFDLETTGLDPKKHEIIEIGAILVNRDSSHHKTFQSLVKPRRKIPKKITEITGITQAMVDRDGVGLDVAIHDFQEFIGDLMLVAYNAEFDTEFLHNSSPRAGGKPFFNPSVCALQMARLAWPGRKSYRLSELAKDGGLSTDDSHRALGDCKRLLAIYIAASVKLGRGYAQTESTYP